MVIYSLACEQNWLNVSSESTFCHANGRSMIMYKK